MKITDITVENNRLPLKVPFITALRRADTIDELIITIKTDTSICGKGAAVAVTAVTGETLETIETTILNIIKPKITGLNLLAYQNIFSLLNNAIEHHPGAKAAVDMAIYDCLAQFYQMPLYQWLGGESKTLLTDLTISLNDIDTMVSDAKKAVAEGFSILKIKVGDGSQKDIDRVYAIAEGTKAQAKLRIDANQAWSVKDAIEIIKDFEKQSLSIDLIEQPVKAADFEGLKSVKNNVNIPILADESVFNAKDAIKLLCMQAVDLLSIKLLKTGGIYPALTLVSIAETFNVECMLSCMLEGPLGINAACHLALAKPETITRIDLDAVFLGKSPIDRHLVGLKHLSF